MNIQLCVMVMVRIIKALNQQAEVPGIKVSVLVVAKLLNIVVLMTAVAEEGHCNIQV